MRFNPDAVTWPNCLFLENTVADIFMWKRRQEHKDSFIYALEACKTGTYCSFSEDTASVQNIDNFGAKDKARLFKLGTPFQAKCALHNQ